MRLVVACVALLVVLAFPGCGGDDGDGKDSFVDQADVVCSEAEAEISRVPPPQDPTDPLQLAGFLERAVPVAQKQNAELKELERPDEQRAQINELIAALDAEVDAAERMLAAAKREDRQAIQQLLTESGLASAQAKRAAAELDLAVCGAA
jgi:multidrug resistance efflux pump